MVDTAIIASMVVNEIVNGIFFFANLVSFGLTTAFTFEIILFLGPLLCFVDLNLNN